MKRIIITGAGGPAGVNFINSLRLAPEPFYIVALDTNPFHLEWANANEKHVIPRWDNKNYIAYLKQIIKKTDAEFLHSQPDKEVRIISENRENLRIRTFLPSKESIQTCQDKYLSATHWKKLGVHSLETLYVSANIKSLRRAAKLFGYPYWLRASQGASSRGSTPVPNFTTAQSWIQYWRARGTNWKFIAQKLLPGRNIAFQSLWKNGKLITSQARERIEYIYPQLAPSGITNTPIIARTVHDNRINEIAQKAVLAIDPAASGIFCIDLKEDEMHNPVPTEINCGRFFTTSFFFTKAGINMPYLYVKLAFNEKIPAVPTMNAVPPDWYWLRHIDCPAILVKNPSYGKTPTIRKRKRS